jgi:hypothetical protein
MANPVRRETGIPEKTAPLAAFANCQGPFFLKLKDHIIPEQKDYGNI